MNTQISKITTLLLNYPMMLQVWNATEFVFLSDDCVGFKVNTQIYNGTVIIAWQDDNFYYVNFRDMDLKILGLTRAERVLDAVKNYVEKGDVCVRLEGIGYDNFRASTAIRVGALIRFHRCVEE